MILWKNSSHGCAQDYYGLPIKVIIGNIKLQAHNQKTWQNRVLGCTHSNDNQPK